MIDIPTLDGKSVKLKRDEIKRYFQHCYRRYESLFELISDDEAYYQKADKLRHPIIFYYGHTATFFINKFRLAKIIDDRINPQLESIFAVGVDEMSWDDLDESHYNWPSIEETQIYRQKVYDLVTSIIEETPLVLPITQDSPWWVILMGIEHENIHLETSSVLIRQLPIRYIKEHKDYKECDSYADAPTNELIEVAGGGVSLGKDKLSSKLFGWDNEYGEHSAYIPTFRASKYLVSNGEFLEFVEDGGYSNDSFWSDEGKEWRDTTQASHPLFWMKSDSGYRFRTLSREIELPLNFPVEVNALEAMAFCRWKSIKLGKNIKLPTEDEYIRLRDVSGVEPFINKEPNSANINLEAFSSSTPVDRYSHGEFYDVVGNVWQWSDTPIYPFEGFEVHPIYDDFSVPTFDNRHNLINGGSWISCGNLATHKSRYAFRRHFYQHAGFRYVQSSYGDSLKDDIYSMDSVISQYCHFGWGEESLSVENYPSRCSALALEYMGGRSTKRALDIGCAIGRSSFELSKGFDEVIGIDFSTRFIQEAQRLKDKGVLRYTLKTEGDLSDSHKIDISKFYSKEQIAKVSFFQGDACNLKPIYRDFDLILGANLLDRLYDPLKFLDSLGLRINRGGLLILTSPYTWQESSTPKDKWIGGYSKDGKDITTLDALIEILGEDFRLIDTKDIPFVIKESARKYQYTIAQMSVWEKI